MRLIIHSPCQRLRAPWRQFYPTCGPARRLPRLEVAKKRRSGKGGRPSSFQAAKDTCSASRARRSGEPQEGFGDLLIGNQLHLAFGHVALCRQNSCCRPTNSAITPPLALKAASLTGWRPRQPKPSRCFVPIVPDSDRGGCSTHRQVTINRFSLVIVAS